MSKLDAVIGNPRLEQHLTNYVGFVHLQRFWEHYVDPMSEHEPEIQGEYYRSLREVAYADLKKALLEEADLAAADQDFKSIVKAAIDELIARIGMENIIRSTKWFMWQIEGREPDAIPRVNPYFPSADVARCGVCNRIRVPIGVEDLPTDIIEMHKEVGLELGISWLCLKCHSISNE